MQIEIKNNTESIADVEFSFKVDVLFKSEWIKDEKGSDKLIFKRIIRCGSKEHVSEDSLLSDNILESLMFESFVRYETINNLERKLIHTVSKSEIDAMEYFVKELRNKRGGVTLLDKVNYSILQKKLYGGKNGWKNAYNTFNRSKSKDIDTRLETVKNKYPNLPSHLIDKFADKDSYNRNPARISRLHAAELLGLPFTTEEYRRKTMEGKEMKKVGLFISKMTAFLSRDEKSMLEGINKTLKFERHIQNKNNKNS